MLIKNTPERDLRKASDIFVSSGDDYGAAVTPPPEPEQCEFCGKTLYHRGMRGQNGAVKMWLFLEKCGCEQAKAHYAELERQQKEADKRREAEETNRRRMMRIEKLIGKSGMGTRFRCRTFNTYVCTTEKQQKCFDEAKAYAETFGEHLQDGTGLFFAGSVGTGKTHLAAAIALVLLGHGTPVIFRTAIDMFLDIRRAYSGEVSESDVLHEYKTVPLLVIDDLGKEKMTEWAAATLYGVINARYENMLPIIITTNFSSEDLLKSIGDEPTRAQAILSRLMETSAYISMKWADYRTGGNENV